VLTRARTYHTKMNGLIGEVVSNLHDKIRIIVAVNGPTEYAATRHDNTERKWSLRSKSSARQRGRYSNGDGLVLFQSSVLPGLPLKQYWAVVPDEQEELHTDMLERDDFIDAAANLLAGRRVRGLQRGPEFVRRIDWSGEVAGERDLGLTEDLDAHERAVCREDALRGSEGATIGELDPTGRDASEYADFQRLREAAASALDEGDLDGVSRRTGRS
jgi:hypothetical protein